MMHPNDYVEYLALLLQLIFAPITIVGIVVACHAKRTSEKSRKKVEKNIPKCNYQKNKSMLKGRASR